jgi:hypothetical protein
MFLSDIHPAYIVALALVFLLTTQCVQETMIAGPKHERAMHSMRGPNALLSPSSLGPKQGSGLSPAKHDDVLTHVQVARPKAMEPRAMEPRVARPKLNDDARPFDLSQRRRQYNDLVKRHNSSRNNKERAEISEYLKSIRSLAAARGETARLLKDIPPLK